MSPSFYPAVGYGGPIRSTFELCQSLARRGDQVRVLTTDADGPRARLAVETTREVQLPDGIGIRYCPRIARDSISIALLRELPAALRWGDVVHLTAAYSFPTIPTLTLARLLGRPVVWSPRGAFQRWAGTRRVLGKSLFEAGCRLGAPERLLLHATSQEEADASRARFRGVEVVVVPNGVEIPDTVGHVGSRGPLRLLYLGRLDPIKALENLFRACAALARAGWMHFRLNVAGSGEPGYVSSLARLVESLELGGRVVMIGEVSGEQKRHLFADADLTVVPSHVESFGMVVAESLAHGVPVIASRGTPWPRLKEMGAGLWVENTEVALVEAIRAASRMRLREMGQRGRAWMQAEFSWDQRGREMAEAYAVAANHGRGAGPVGRCDAIALGGRAT